MIFVFNVYACTSALAHQCSDTVTEGLIKNSHCSLRGKLSRQVEGSPCRTATWRVVHVPQLDISLLGEVAVTRCYFEKHRIILSENFIYWLAQRNQIYKIAYSSLLENTNFIPFRGTCTCSATWHALEAKLLFKIPKDLRQSVLQILFFSYSIICEGISKKAHKLYTTTSV